MSVFNLLEKIENTQGSKAKALIVSGNKDNQLLKRIFDLTNDRHTVYYLGQAYVPAEFVPGSSASDDDSTLRQFVKLLESLSDRSLSGSAASAAADVLFSKMTGIQHKWCERILLKNLRCGVQGKTVSNIWPDLDRTFAVQLANKINVKFTSGKIDIKTDLKYPLFVEDKYDGFRCVFSKIDGVVTVKKRSGKLCNTLPSIVRALETAPIDNIVLDGEAMGDAWNDSASVISSTVNVKDDSGQKLYVFEVFTPDEFSNKSCSLSKADRYDRADRLLAPLIAATDKIVQVKRTLVRDRDELIALYQASLDRGQEGIMIKDSRALAVFDRSDAILKFKPVADWDGIIVGVQSGRRNTKNEGRLGKVLVLFHNGVVTNVGGGIDDKLRITLEELHKTDSLVGKIVTVEGQPDPRTADGFSEDGRVRFPVFIRFRDIEDTDGALVECFEKYMEDNA